MQATASSTRVADSAVAMRNGRVARSVQTAQRIGRAARRDVEVRGGALGTVLPLAAGTSGIGFKDDTGLATLARTYANRVSLAWPGSQVWTMRDAGDPSVLRAIVVAPTWDTQRVSEVIDLALMPEAERSGLVVDADVFFQDSGSPDLRGFARRA